MKRLLLSLLAACAIAQPALAENFFVYVGSYTDAPSTSKGIYAARFDSDKGTLEPMGLAAETINPAYLTGTLRGSRIIFSIL
jgi:6-phosphogluconolactonase (cycloisomerase 2 family)